MNENIYSNFRRLRWPQFQNGIRESQLLDFSGQGPFGANQRSALARTSFRIAQVSLRTVQQVYQLPVGECSAVIGFRV